MIYPGKNPGKRLPVVLPTIVLAAVMSVARPAPAAERLEVARRVANEWMQVGIEQYKRGLYSQAEKSLLRAAACSDGLGAMEQKKLEAMVEKARGASTRRLRIVEHLGAVSELVERGRWSEAGFHLEQVTGDPLLTEAESADVARQLAEINQRVDSCRKRFDRIYDQALDSYFQGDFQKAREHFDQIDRLIREMRTDDGEDIVTYEPVMDTLIEPVGALDLAEIPRSETKNLSGTAEAAVDTERKANIIRGHSNAVVRQAVARAQAHISRGRFRRAEQVVEQASQLIENNRPYLGEDLFALHSKSLERITERLLLLKDAHASAQ